MLTNTTIGEYGRFGNQLYQVAALIGLAKKHRHPWAIRRWVNADHRDRFGSKEDVDIWAHLANEIPELPTPCNLQFTKYNVQWGYHEFPLPAGNWDLAGHFQAPRYFAHCMDEVRRVLTFKDEIHPVQAVAVHMRCGDYTDGAETYHPRMTADYYREALKHVPTGIPVYLFSDDIEVAQSVLYAAGCNYFESLSPNHYVTDFCFMKQCTHHIISNSSYSAMAATLANQPGKIVVAPRLWFGAAAGGLSGRDIYEPNWIII